MYRLNASNSKAGTYIVEQTEFLLHYQIWFRTWRFTYHNAFFSQNWIDNMSMSWILKKWIEQQKRKACNHVRIWFRQFPSNLCSGWTDIAENFGHTKSVKIQLNIIIEISWDHKRQQRLSSSSPSKIKINKKNERWHVYDR